MDVRDVLRGEDGACRRRVAVLPLRALAQSRPPGTPDPEGETDPASDREEQAPLASLLRRRGFLRAPDPKIPLFIV